VIFLIRHAHAGVRAAWPSLDGNRPLSARGHHEADQIAALLSGRPITRILSSPRRRCLETLAPLAAARGLGIESEARLDEEAVPGDARAFLEAPAPGTVLCTHGPVIADLLAALAEAGITLRGSRSAGRGSVWELAVEHGRVVSGHYVPPAD
jgi:phosphohistidine phosphatase SixA